MKTKRKESCFFSWQDVITKPHNMNNSQITFFFSFAFTTSASFHYHFYVNRKLIKCICPIRLHLRQGTSGGQ